MDGDTLFDYTFFDYLGFTFSPRVARNSKIARIFTAFTPAISNKAKKRRRESIRKWSLDRMSQYKIEEIANQYNVVISGWINYYAKFGKSEFRSVMTYLNGKLAGWVRRKYKKLKGRMGKSSIWLANLAKRELRMFSHWASGYIPCIRS